MQASPPLHHLRSMHNTMSNQQPITAVSTSTSFRVVTYGELDTSSSTVQASTNASVRQLCDDAASAFSCEVAFVPPEKPFSQRQGCFEFYYSISVTGSPQQMGAAWAFLAANNPTQSLVTIKSTRKVILTKGGEMKATVKARLDQIMKATHTQITCVGQLNDRTMITGIVPESLDLEIIGRAHAVEVARYKCLILLDEMAGLSVERVEVELELQPICSGRMRVILEALMQETCTNIYCPPLLVQNLDSDPELDSVFVSGSSLAVREAKVNLENMIVAKRKGLIRRQVHCLPRKIDWLFSNRKDQLKKIMNDNAVYVRPHAIGSNTPIITVIGDDSVYIERAIRALMCMACEYYVASLQILGGFSRNPDAQTAAILRQISYRARSDIVHYGDVIELYGLEKSVKGAFQIITDGTLFKPVVGDIKFQLELALEHKEFINGKKSGKINKIVKSSGCRIQFHENHNDYNMIIEVADSGPLRALEGLTMLEDELPAEMSFYIPEAYHKRIIGVGGKNIQRIMKKYGVYVKFSNAEEYALLGGYFENLDNVIARTPAKNASNLELLKQSIFELISVKDKPEVKSSISIPCQMHRIVMGPRASNIRELERLYRVNIVFPSKDSGSDEIFIEGPEAHVQQARIHLHQFVPEVHDFQIPATHAAIFVLRSPDFTDNLVPRLYQELGIEVYVQTPSLTDWNGQEISFMLYYMRGNTNIERSKIAIFDFLKSKQVTLQTPPQISTRSGSYANLAPQKSYDSFQHFNSKLLSPVTPAHENPFASAVSPNFGLFDSSSFDVPRSARPPGAHSVPNLRQLFDNTRPVSAPVEHPLQRSLSYLEPDVSPTNILSSTLSAMALSTGEAWDQQMPMFSHTTEGPPGLTENEGKSQVSARKSDESGRTSHSYSDSEKGHSDSNSVEGHLKVPNDKFRGLSLSRSDDKVNRRVGKAPTKLSSLVIESHINENDEPAVFNQELIEQILNEDPAKGLETFLASLELSMYLPTFNEQEVDFRMLLTLGEADLKELGVKTFGSRKKMLNAIKELNQARKWEARHQAPASAPIIAPSRPPGLPIFISKHNNSQQGPASPSDVRHGHFSTQHQIGQFLPRGSSPGPHSALGLAPFQYPPPNAVSPLAIHSGAADKTNSSIPVIREPPVNATAASAQSTRARP